MMDDTIYALSSGAPPSAIAIIRISGPDALNAAKILTGKDFMARRASLATLRDENGAALDQAIVIPFPGPNSATGEDCVELHCHGSRAVVRAVERALGRMAGLRAAEPGEFTRRSFANGRLDLAEVEGLGQLLAAETELQRQVALGALGGSLSRKVGEFRQRILTVSAMVEGALDHSDEDDIGDPSPLIDSQLDSLRSDIEATLNRPTAEKLASGIRVALAGPPNAGKSTLFNALLEDEVAIATPIAGTTRDVLERSVQLEGMPFTFVDMAGLRNETDDEIERMGIKRARAELDGADIVLWLGQEGEGPEGSIEIAPQADRIDFETKSNAALRVSAVSGEGMDALRDLLFAVAREQLPRPDSVALNQRQRNLLARALVDLDLASEQADLLLAGESLRLARQAFDEVAGRTGTEDLLNSLFGAFCIGK